MSYYCILDKICNKETKIVKFKNKKNVNIYIPLIYKYENILLKFLYLTF
jgi:hypothetical protein